jgi:cell division protein FtsQ
MNKGSLLKDQAVKRDRKGRFFLMNGIFRALGSGLVRITFLCILLTLISAGFLSGYHYLLSSPYLRLEQIEVRGVRDDIRREILRMGDLEPGKSLLSIHLRSLKPVLEGHPWVRSVRLERRFPHALWIEAEEQVPLAVVVSGKLFYLNRQGEVFKEVEDSESVDFPLITGVSLEDRDAREKLMGAAGVIHFLAVEEEEWSVGVLSELHLKDRERFSLYFSNLGVEIKMTPSEIFARMHELKRIVQDLNREGRMHRVTGIDLNYPDGAVVSFKKS